MEKKLKVIPWNGQLLPFETHWYVFLTSANGSVENPVEVTKTLVK